jgi:hypothetical protein
MKGEWSPFGLNVETKIAYFMAREQKSKRTGLRSHHPILGHTLNKTKDLP